MAFSIFRSMVCVGFFCTGLSDSLPQPKLPGCFADDINNRQLPHQICLVTGGCAMLSREWCGYQCASNGFELAAVEASHQCACGSHLSSPTMIAPATECNEPCTGDPNETCGGDLRAWIYNASSVGPPQPQPQSPLKDTRHIPNGRVIHTGGYCCQPYCDVLPDTSWSCVMTFNNENYVEGTPGEHMIAMRSTDEGKTWSEFVAISNYSNTTTDQVSAYGSITGRPDGSRLFAVWIQNTAGIDHLPGKQPSPSFRADMLGQFVWKYSDDKGASWSAKHYVVPIPMRFIDRSNSFNGSVQIMWEVDHIKQHNGVVMLAFTKIGTYAVAPPEEVYIMVSTNLLTEEDPEKVEWETWPNNDHGIQAVGGTAADSMGIVEEPHVLPLEQVDAYHVVFRTSQGYLGSAQSQQNDPTLPWKPSWYAQYLSVDANADWVALVHPNASSLKNPRGPISPKRQPNGLFLMTFYNNNGFGAFAQKTPVSDRNNMWLVAGHEINGTLQWTQPELVLYDRRRDHGHGYPDVITSHTGDVYITETYKSSPGSEAKTHPVNSNLVSLLFTQTTLSTVAANHTATFAKGGGAMALPLNAFPNFFTYPQERYGFSMDFWVAVNKPTSKEEANHEATTATTTTITTTTTAAQSLFHGTATSATSATTKARVDIYMHPNGTTVIDMMDTNGTVITWTTDPVCSHQLGKPGKHYIAIIADAGPKMLSWVVDGHLCDGGPHGYAFDAAKSSIVEGGPAGWSLFDPMFGSVTPLTGAEIGQVVLGGHLYSRALYISECIGNWRAGLSQSS